MLPTRSRSTDVPVLGPIEDYRGSQAEYCNSPARGLSSFFIMDITTTSVLSALATCRSEPESEDALKRATEISLVWLFALPCSSQPVPHWCCSKALPSHPQPSNQEWEALKEATTLLVRLCGFKGNKAPIQRWKDGIDACITNCCDCVEGWESAKVGFRER
jgi:hypothetical protein